MNRRKKIEGQKQTAIVPPDDMGEEPADLGEDVPTPEEPEPEPAQPGKKSKWVHQHPWGEIVHRTFDLDIRKTHSRLVAELSLGEGATEYGVVIAALDQCSRNAFDAARLTRAAKLADEAHRQKLDERKEVLRSQASAELSAEHRDGKRSKAPTIADIEGRMIRSWPDEMAELQRSLAEMHGAFRATESLEKAWWDRCQVMRALAQQFGRSGTT